MENKFKFLFKYSLTKKLRNKWFLVINVILLILLVGLINIDGIIKFFGGDFSNSSKIKIIDNTGYYNVIKKDLSEIKSYLPNSDISIKRVSNIDKEKKNLKDTNDILLVINNDENNIFKVDFITYSYVDIVEYQAIAASLTASKRSIYLEKSNIDTDTLNKINSDVKITRSFIDKEKSKDQESSKLMISSISLVIVLPCFMLIVFLVQMIGAEINEEKSTRGMEIIIGNVSPKAHFFSKILSNNIFILFQGLLILLYGGIGLIIRKIANNNSISNISSKIIDTSSILDTLNKNMILDKLQYVIPLILILIILSFLAYSLLAGILASVTTNMENFGQLQTPLMIINVVGYYLILLSSTFPGSTFIKVISCIPLLSISLAPSMLLSGEIGVGIIIISILLLALFDYILIKYGLKVYKTGILNYSDTGLWKKIFKAIKEE